jgi:hypothetical protein
MSNPVFGRLPAAPRDDRDDALEPLLEVEDEGELPALEWRDVPALPLDGGPGVSDGPPELEPEPEPEPELDERKPEPGWRLGER